jgi:hypothetical protein
MALLPPARPRCDDDSPWIKCSRFFSWSNRSRVASVVDRPKSTPQRRPYRLHVPWPFFLGIHRLSFLLPQSVWGLPNIHLAREMYRTWVVGRCEVFMNHLLSDPFSTVLVSHMVGCSVKLIRWKKASKDDLYNGSDLLLGDSQLSLNIRVYIKASHALCLLSKDRVFGTYWQ